MRRRLDTWAGYCNKKGARGGYERTISHICKEKYARAVLELPESKSAGYILNVRELDIRRCVAEIFTRYIGTQPPERLKQPIPKFANIKMKLHMPVARLYSVLNPPTPPSNTALLKGDRDLPATRKWLPVPRKLGKITGTERKEDTIKKQWNHIWTGNQSFRAHPEVRVSLPVVQLRGIKMVEGEYLFKQLDNS